MSAANTAPTLALVSSRLCHHNQPAPDLVLSILPFAALALLTLLIRLAARKDWREAALLAAISWGVLTTAVTEGLSALGILQRAAVGAAWGVIDLVLMFGLVVAARRRAGVIPRGSTEESHPWSPLNRVLIVYLALVVLTTGVTALVAPPNMYDLLTYHMSRVVHWIQNESVDHYPSHILRQLFMSPWASYAALQFQILTGGDRFAGIVSWLALGGATAGVSLIARELGATRQAQLWTMVICASIPGGILEAASGQSDYVAAFWLVCFAWAALRARTTADARLSGGEIFVLGASLGLAILTKVTVYFFAFPLLVWLCVGQLRARGARAIPALAGIAAITLALNAGLYARNLRLFGDPLRARGANAEVSALNEDLGPKTAILGLVRHGSLHIGSPQRLRVQSIVEGGARALHRALGVDPDDPRLSFRGLPFEVRGPTLQDSTGNHLHFVMLLAALLLLAVRWRKESLRLSARYTILVMAGFVIFTYLFKWHGVSARLHLPVFVLASPAIAVALADFARAMRLGHAIVVVLAMASLPWLFSARSRPIVPIAGWRVGASSSILFAARTDLYYLDRTTTKREIEGAAGFIRSKGCGEVGLIEDWNDTEYPIWVALDAPKRTRIHHVLVANASAAARELAFPDSLCAIVVRSGSGSADLQIGRQTYRAALSIGSTSVLVPQPQR